MYNVQRILDFKAETQKEIDLLMGSRKVKLLKIIEQELAEGDKFLLNMGSCVIEDKNGEHLDNDFIDELAELNYEDAFDTGFEAFEFPVPKQEGVLVFKEVDHCWWVCEECPQFCIRDNNSLYLRPEDRVVSWEICDANGEAFGGQCYTLLDDLISFLERVTKKRITLD